jgi:hypothetical protein
MQQESAVLTQIRYGLLVCVGCALIGCSNAAPPAPMVIPPEKQTQELKDMDAAAREIDEKGIGNVSEETIKKSAGVAGGKLQKAAQNQGGGN